MTGKNLQQSIRDELLKDECIFKLVVLKAGDKLRDIDDFKECYNCIGNNPECKAYEPYIPKKQEESKG